MKMLTEQMTVSDLSDLRVQKEETERLLRVVHRCAKNGLIAKSRTYACSPSVALERSLSLNVLLLSYCEV